MSNKGKKGNMTRAEAKRVRQRGRGLTTTLPLTVETLSDTMREPLLRDMTPDEIATGEVKPNPKPTFTHIDEFIDYGTSITEGSREENEDYARWLFNHWRLPAITRSAFEPFMKDYKLFCEFEDEKWRVTGASRLGDVWLTKNFEQDCGYQRRVAVDDCSKWSRD